MGFPEWPTLLCLTSHIFYLGPNWGQIVKGKLTKNKNKELVIFPILSFSLEVVDLVTWCISQEEEGSWPRFTCSPDSFSEQSIGYRFPIRHFWWKWKCQWISTLLHFHISDAVVSNVVWHPQWHGLKWSHSSNWQNGRFFFGI